MWSRIVIIGGACAALLVAVYFAGVTVGHRSAPKTAEKGADIRIDFANKPGHPGANVELSDTGSIEGFTGQIMTLSPMPMLFVDGRVDVSGGKPATPALQKSYAKIRAYMAAHDLKAAGPPIAINVDFDTIKHIWKYRAGIALATTPAMPPSQTDGIILGSSHGGAVVRFVHLGDPNQAESTYAKIEQWMQSKRLTASGPSWEEYTSDPQTPVSQWRTNIYVPL